MSSAISTHPESRVGQMVIYKLSDYDAKAIVASRLSAGRGTVTGNDPREGDEYPALIIRDWAPHDNDALRAKIAEGNTTISGTPVDWDAFVRQASVNLQVFLDGTDVYWATSRSEFDPAKHGTFAKRSEEELRKFFGIDEDDDLRPHIAAYQNGHHLNRDGQWGSSTDAVAVGEGDLPALPLIPDAKGHFFTV